MTVYGYARVSSGDQDLTIQQNALKAAGCTNIRAEKASGTSRKGRTELQILMDFMQAGDTLTVTRIDRLARSTHDLQIIVRDLMERGIHLRATEQPIDTSTAAGKLFLDMLGAFAEFETRLRRDRQMEGIERAKREGKPTGRPQVAYRAHVLELRTQGMSVAAICKEVGAKSRSTIYDIIKQGA